MPPRIRTGYRCACGALVVFEGGGLESIGAFEEQREKQRQSGWTMLVTHAEAVGGCGESIWVKADDIIPFEDQAE